MPQAKITQLTDWNRFGTKFSHTYFLEPENSEFIQVGSVFLDEYRKVYGTDHFYNIDLFNEETPSSSQIDYLRQCGKNVYKAIQSIDSEGIWY
ncbi:Alpha-N-acetylglucosaminidase-like protein 2 [Sarcoptes scabiei]|uniref:Alpha-N-acetylglucosaminidase-like protein 2 n=1 Tax=Sarcoptes scabiei TaxID=52283 RepID=A0A131ZU16_SARSC|nr:Alpha-N-acetylglucosaminidase-like protein 2 [Sarcoptes scabiei]